MTDDKKFSSHRRQYAVLSRETIRTYAEVGGHEIELPDELASLLAEEVVYRLRELTQVGVWDVSYQDEVVTCVTRNKLSNSW